MFELKCLDCGKIYKTVNPVSMSCGCDYSPDSGDVDETVSEAEGYLWETYDEEDGYPDY